MYLCLFWLGQLSNSREREQSAEEEVREIYARKSGDFSGNIGDTTANLISTERRKHRDSAEKSDKAESKQLSHNCHITSTGRVYLVQELTGDVGEERVGRARANKQKKKERTQLGMIEAIKKVIANVLSE